MIELNRVEDIKKMIATEDMLLLYFGNHVWGVCVDLEPKVRKMLGEYEKISSAYIDVDKNMDLAARYSMFVIPGILFYIQGKEFIRDAGTLSVPKLKSEIDRYYHMFFDEE